MIINTTPIEFRFAKGQLSSINRVPGIAIAIVKKYEPLFGGDSVQHDDGTWSEYSDLKPGEIKSLQDELAASGFQWATKVLA